MHYNKSRCNTMIFRRPQPVLRLISAGKAYEMGRPYRFPADKGLNPRRKQYILFCGVRMPCGECFAGFSLTVMGKHPGPREEAALKAAEAAD